MHRTPARRRTPRLFTVAVAFALAVSLGGCGTMPSFDPTDLLDFLDTKKRAPGERKPVFPEGVPGISQGVPRELVRGSPESRAAEANAAPAPPVETQPPPPPARRAGTAAKRPSRQSPVEIAPDDVNVEDDQPPPPPRRQAQRSQRAAQPQPEQQANPFPTPLPR